MSATSKGLGRPSIPYPNPLPYLLRMVSLLSLPLQQDMTLLVAIVAIGPYLGASVESFSTFGEGLSHPKT